VLSFGWRCGGISQQTANQAVQLFKRRKLLAALISGEHGFEGVCSGEDNLRESRSVFLSNLRRKDIFEFVSKLA